MVKNNKFDKNQRFLIISLLMVITMNLYAFSVYGVDYTDQSRSFIQTVSSPNACTSSCYTSSSYSLRSNMNPYTQINISSPNWDSCSVILGGSKYGGYPLSYTSPTTNYKHFSFVSLMANSLRQYDAKCNIIDEYVFSGTPVSNLAIVNKAKFSSDPNINHLPYFAFAYKVLATNNTYMYILTLNDETSKFEVVNLLYIGNSTWSNFNENIGVAGGYRTANFNSYDKEDLTFGLFNKNSKNMKLFYTSLNFSRNIYVPITATHYTDMEGYSTQDTYYLNKILYFDDMNKDGVNDFILIQPSSYVSGAFDKSSLYWDVITFSDIYPYYSILKSKYTQDISGTDGSPTPMYAYSLCSIGDLDDTLKICLVAPSNNAVQLITTIIHYNESRKPYFSLNETYRYTPFTIQKNNKNIFCYINETKKIKCIDENGVLKNYFNLIKGFSDSYNYGTNFYVGELDGNISSPEIIYSSGEIESIRWNSTNINLGYWNNAHYSPTFNDISFKGEMYIQDISGDNKSELIYFDNETLEIYSMDSTPFILRNATSGGFVTNASLTTTTTIESDAEIMLRTGLPSILGKLQDNIMIIMALILILGLMTSAHSMGGGNPLIIIGAGVIGVIICVTLGMISSSLLVILIIVLALLGILGFTLLKPK